MAKKSVEWWNDAAQIDEYRENTVAKMRWDNAKGHHAMADAASDSRIAAAMPRRDPPKASAWDPEPSGTSGKGSASYWAKKLGRKVRKANPPSEARKAFLISKLLGN